VTAKRLLVTDADNTLWDTDAVYAGAQLDLLDRIEELYNVAFDSTDRLAFVRRLDQELAREHPLGLRYPPRLLVEAIVATGGGRHTNIRQTAPVHPDDDSASINKIAESFLARVLSEIPSLRPGVSKTLPLLVANGAAIVVFTEGDPHRCERLLAVHDLRRHVSTITATRKTVQSYETILRTYSRVDDPMMVGDQLDRDIVTAQRAGFKGIYFPGSFEPEWVRAVEATPDYLISSFDDILDIIQ
jgi:putative hydrolase of the HAD superfamily